MRGQAMAAVPLVVTLLGLIGCGVFATPRQGAPSPTAVSTTVERGTEPVSPPETSPPTSTAPAEPTGKATPRPIRTPTARPTGDPSRTPTPAVEPTVARSPTLSPPGSSAPRVIAFSAVVHEVVELSWDTTAEHVTICPLTGSGLVYCRCLYDLPGSGRTTIEPDQIIAPYAGFELSADSGGARTIGRVSADVACPGHGTWFLEDPPSACSDGSPLISRAVAQRFERGLMIWVAATDAYYVFYDRDLNVEDGRGWSSLKSLQRIGGPLALKPGAGVDNRVGEVPPADRFEPVSGFGLVWRGEVMGTEQVRERLGWAVEEEYAFETVSQCEAGCGPARDCYLRGPQGLVAGTAGGDADGDGDDDPWTLIEERAQFQALMHGPTPDRVLGTAQVYQTLQVNRSGDYFADPYVVPFIETVPTLEEMTRAALNVVDDDPDGFFLMVEGGAIDWASHGNSSGRMIEEAIAFEEAIESVVDWVRANSNWGETLLIITADHETGYLTGPGSHLTWEPIVNNGAGNLPGMEWRSGDHTNSLVPLFAKGDAGRLFNRYADEFDPVHGRYADNTEVAEVLFWAMDPK